MCLLMVPMGGSWLLLLPSAATIVVLCPLLPCAARSILAAVAALLAIECRNLCQQQGLCLSWTFCRGSTGCGAKGSCTTYINSF